MDFEIVELEEFSGPEATVYSVLMDKEETTLFGKFVVENDEQHSKGIDHIYNTLYAIGFDVGAREQFFKKEEGVPGDLVCALYDNQRKGLRLFCIRLGKSILILGGGGFKNVRSWQDDEKLTLEVQRVMEISRLYYEKIHDKEIGISNDGLHLIGNLVFKDNAGKDES